ncbi:inositol monophosphatase family protein [Ectobacillus polymachus]|uniref:inositol monophosphatase family protein n=1 Tax=Ectobacillus polymachus TaxID=1508806 RepID=UPI003A86A486
MHDMWNGIAANTERWIREAGQILRDSLETTLTIETKTSASDLVTNMDRHIEQFFISRIHDTYPLHKIVGEEGYGDEIASAEGTIWLIDPIDGTMNFVHQKRNFAISIGIYHDGVGKIGYIYDPIHDELYYAMEGKGAYCNGVPIPKLQAGTIEKGMIGVNATWLLENNFLDYKKIAALTRRARGTRSYGCAALEIVYVATGKLDAYITPRLSPWDYGGGAILISEVGGYITTFQQAPVSLIEKGSVIVARPGVYEELLPFLC